MPSFTDTVFRTYFLVAGWSILGYVSYKAATAKIDNKVYNPFEILGIKSAGIFCLSYTNRISPP